MFSLKDLVDGYVKASFHVALMVVCFFEMTQYQWLISTSFMENSFIFCLAFLGYNGIKYYPFPRKTHSTPWLYPLMVPASGLAIIYALYYGISLPLAAQFLVFLCGGLCIVYAVPLKASLGNLRSRFGVKIFIVALCWTLLTAVFPLIDLPQWTIAHYHFFMERFCLIFVATLPFEIHDSAKDQIDLGTIPQLIGLNKTRWLGAIILFIAFGLKVFVFENAKRDIIAFGIIGMAYLVALFRVHPAQSENITLFWVEFIPALGWLCYC